MRDENHKKRRLTSKRTHKLLQDSVETEVMINCSCVTGVNIKFLYASLRPPSHTDSVALFTMSSDFLNKSPEGKLIPQSICRQINEGPNLQPGHRFAPLILN